jgi:hypothetical protein
VSRPANLLTLEIEYVLRLDTDDLRTVTKALKVMSESKSGELSPDDRNEAHVLAQRLARAKAKQFEMRQKQAVKLTENIAKASGGLA